MKMFQMLLFVILTLLPTLAFAKDVNVRGYNRKDGAYVEPHTRSTPNAYKWDNKNYTPSQPAYNESYTRPTKNYSSDWYQPSSTRYEDSNPYNDSAPIGIQPIQGIKPLEGIQPLGGIGN